MQSVMFNSQHISVSKDTLHSHKILRRPPEAKIASLLSQKDEKKQKNKITHQRTSRAAVYLDPFISYTATQQHILSTDHDQHECERN